MAEEQDVQPHHEEAEEVKDRGLKEKIEEHLHGGHDSSSSDSDNEKPAEKPVAHPAEKPVAHPAESSLKDKVYRLFGRERPVHHVLGGGKPADVMLWRNKKISAGVLGGATAIWILFELMEYHLITLIAHGFIFTLAALFLYSNGRTFIHKSPPRIPEVTIPEDQVVNIVLRLRYDINKALAVLREIALGRDLKKFLVVIAGLWILSVIGTWADFLTLFYILFVTLHTVPVLYEKYDDKVDAFAEKIMAELKKHYAVVDAKVISKIPRGPLKDKKH